MSKQLTLESLNVIMETLETMNSRQKRIEILLQQMLQAQRRPLPPMQRVSTASPARSTTG